MKKITIDQGGNRWRESKKILKEDSIREVDVWNGKSFEKHRMVSKAGTEVRTFTSLKPTTESKHSRRARLVSPSLRYYLEEQAYYGQLNEAGKLILNLEFKRGGRKPKAPIWWIVKKAAEIKEKYFYSKTRVGIALKLSDMAQQEFGEYKDITFSDINNARRAIKMQK